MNRWCLLLAASACMLVQMPAAGQNSKPTTKATGTLRTSWGAPDLQGVWDFSTITPLERPEALANKAVLTAEEAAALEAQARSSQQAARPATPGNVGAYNAFWSDLGSTIVEGRRTSLIIDPPDGKLPAVQPGVIQQFGSPAEDHPYPRPIRFRVGGSKTDGPEDRGLSERCLMGFNTGPPITPRGYNRMIQMFQTQDYVVVFNEMIHDARIIPLDGRPHLSTKVRQWMGDSRGHWEGDTLVVETTNFTGKTASFQPDEFTAFGNGEHLRVVERFRRGGPDSLLYEFTIDDASTFVRPFTVALPMRRSDGKLYEYACHEGNYAMPTILRAARMKDGGTK